MSLQMEKLEHNMAKLTIEVPAEDFDKAVEKAYQKRKHSITVPGFRKGKAPRKMIEKLYGTGVFYEDAANEVIPEAYQEAVKDCEETICSRPSVDVVQVEAGKPFIFTAEVALKPEAQLGEYKGIAISAQSTEVTDEDIDREIGTERERNARFVDVDDRPVQNGDNVRLDFAGTVDGVAFDGGSAEDYPLTIGSGSFIPGFEEQLVGMNIDDEKDVAVTFPEDYHVDDLKGKAAVFHCKINGIQTRELPELDDEFAQDVSGKNTLEEYREEVRAKLQDQKNSAARNAKEMELIEKIVENATMDIPDAMVDEQVSIMSDDFVRRIQSQGITVEQYMQITGLNQAQLLGQMRPEALRRIKESLVLEAVVKAEGIEATDEEVEKEISDMAESYSMEVDKLKGMMKEDELKQIRTDISMRKAIDLLLDSAVETETV